MSVSTILNIGARAMTANYAALQTTGNNIANANTPGYSRQSVQLATSFSQQTGSGFFGKGVDITTVTRAHSDFLTREAATTQSLAAADASRSGQMQQLEQVFRLGEAGLGHSAQQAFNAFVDVASNPQDASARQTALARVGDMADRFRAASQQLDSLQSGVTGELRTSVASINTLTKQIADLNQRIASVSATNHTPNDLLDQRDLAIGQLSQLVQVTTIAAPDGSVGVFLGGSQRLVLGAEATPLLAVPDAFDPGKLQLGISDGGAVRAFPDGFAGGGSVAGLLRFQDHDLADARSRLGQLASAIGGALNAQQALGVDLGQPSGAGAPLLALGAPRVLPSSGNAASGGVPTASYVNANGERVSSVAIVVVDSAQAQPSDYELAADPALPAGQYRLTRLSDGVARTVAAGDVVDGFRIDIASPAPAANDRFRLQPVSTSAGQMARVLDDPKGIAAASPVTATAAPGNAGTATVASVAAVSTSLDANLAATITFTDDLGNFSYSLVDSTGTSPPASGSGAFVAGQPIALNGWALRLAGVPKTGDVLSVAKTRIPAGNNGNANALLALRDANIVAGQTVTDAYAGTLGAIGVRVQSAKLAAEQSQAIAADAGSAAAAQSGVNLDEEAARLIQYQQTYQAAAKILQIAQTVFDSLLQIAR